MVTLQQKQLFGGRSAGVTLLLQRHSPGKGTPLVPHPPLTGAPSAACFCQWAGALGHRPLLGSLHTPAHSLNPQVTSVPLSTVSPTAPRQPQGDHRSAARPLGTEPPLLRAPSPLELPSGPAPTCRQGGCSASRATPAKPITARRTGGRAGSHQPDTGFLRPPRSATAGPQRRGVPLASDPDGGPGGAGEGPAGERLPRPDRPARLVSTGRAAAGRGPAPSRRGTAPGGPAAPSAESPPRPGAARHGGGGPRQSPQRSRRAALPPSLGPGSPQRRSPQTLSAGTSPERYLAA